jgi:hypothetical protein
MAEASTGGGSEKVPTHYADGGAISSGHMPGISVGSGGVSRSPHNPHKPALPVAPPTSHQLDAAQRQLERRLDQVRADFEAHSAEAHPRPLPNFVGSIQAQWQVVPAPVKQMVYMYGAIALVGITIRLLVWFLASFRHKREEPAATPAMFVRRWPPTQ